MTSSALAFTVGAEEAGERADVVVARRGRVPRAAARAALERGVVTVAGRRVRPSRRLAAGDHVTGRVEAWDPRPPEPEDIPVTVVYADERVLVVSKPAGLVTHPGAGHRSGTLVNALLALGGPLAAMGTTRPGIVHRLDKDTSGLLLVARDDAAHARLVGALRERRLERRYLALVAGIMPAPTGTIDAPVGRHPTRPRRRAVVAGGRAAVTHYSVVATASDASLLDLGLDSGRTHQIRVHLAHVGHPVVGDRTYGSTGDLARRLGLTRPFLHAWRLAWPDPATGENRAVEDPLPSELREALARAGLADSLATRRRAV